MHAIIRQGNGKYYVSAVFGYYRDITASDDYERYLQSIHKPYWIVWDPDKKRLIRWLTMEPDTVYIIPQILIVDSDQSNWILNDDKTGCVDFLTRERIDAFLDKEVQPQEILDKCKEIDKGYVYKDIQEIRTQADIENLDWVSGNFHDAYIAEEKLLNDGTLYVRFDGVWGCQIEVWFQGDLEYDTSSRNPETSDPYWFASTVILQDGFVYFVDEEDMTVEKITPGYCYFKSRNMKYRVIPD